jgi:hypothetical protein
MHRAACPLAFALVKAGSKREARIAMMAITTSNSIKVNPLSVRETPADRDLKLRFVCIS